jgi:Ni/Co efflux regulator RcnB
MMKMITLGLAAAIALSGLTAAPADAQPPGRDWHHRDHDRDRDRDRGRDWGRHHDRGRDHDRGWRHDRGWHRGWHRGRHDGWGRHRRPFCHWIWRHRHRERICAWRRW